MKIYDCFTFFNEIDLLKIRLEYLYDYVDKFVISESNLTFAGQKKPFYFLNHKKEFSRWQNKIVYLQCYPNINNLVFDKPKKYNPRHGAWSIEALQRNFLATGIVNLKESDLFILSDLVEIWNPRILKDPILKQDSFESASIEMSFHYFFMNCRGIGSENSSWTLPLIIKNSFFKKNSSKGLNSFRTREIFKKSIFKKTIAKPSLIKNGGWHFSYLGGPQSVINKIESFSHQELNNNKNKEIKKIKRCIDLGIDPFERKSYIWGFYPINFYPQSLQSLMKKYPHFIKKSLM